MLIDLGEIFDGLVHNPGREDLATGGLLSPMAEANGARALLERR